MNKRQIGNNWRARRSFCEGGKQMLDPKNQPTISFEQVTNMLKEMEQTHSKIMANTEAYRIQHRILESLYSGLHSKLQGLHKLIENLEERLTISYTVIKTPKVLPLATLLDSHCGGDYLGIHHEHSSYCFCKEKKEQEENLEIIVVIGSYAL